MSYKNSITFINIQIYNSVPYVFTPYPFRAFKHFPFYSFSQIMDVNPKPAYFVFPTRIIHECKHINFYFPTCVRLIRPLWIIYLIFVIDVCVHVQGSPNSMLFRGISRSIWDIKEKSIVFCFWNIGYFRKVVGLDRSLPYFQRYKKNRGQSFIYF